MDREAWQAIVHGVIQSWTRLSNSLSHGKFPITILDPKEEYSISKGSIYPNNVTIPMTTINIKLIFFLL